MIMRHGINTFGSGPDSFPTGSDDPSAPRRKATDPNYRLRLKLLNYVREHGNYLTPGSELFDILHFFNFM